MPDTRMPSNPLEQTYALALQHHRAGQLREADALYRQILASDPNHADALQMLGGIAFLAGQHGPAVELIRRAIAINPEAADYHSNLAIVLASSGQTDAAIDELRQAIAIRPDYAEAQYNLGKIFSECGRLAEAIDAYQSAVALNPRFAEAHNNLGDLLRRAGQLERATLALGEALAQRPAFPEALFNLALVLQDQGRLDEARGTLERLLRQQPNHAEAHNEMGNVLRELNRPGEALAAYRRAAELKPAFAEARWHAGMVLLSLGKFEEGWAAYEARRRELRAIWREPAFAQPGWDGAPLGGRRILLWAEQGFGDTIQFLRYAPLVRDRDGRVVLRCQPGLKRLLAGQLGIEQVIDDSEALPPVDVQCPLMSLPHLLHTTLQTIPAGIPYLAPDPALVATWRKRILSLSSPDSLSASPRPHVAVSLLNIGLAWATNLQPASALKRWIDIEALGQLAGVQNARFFSLQKAPSPADRMPIPGGLNLIDWTGELTDFAQTAALIAQFDLVVTCDTAVAHLAGAMGKPTWVALPFAAPWRWMHQRSDSPWYPTVRLFRQRKPGDWAGLMEEMKAELGRFEVARNVP